MSIYDGLAELRAPAPRLACLYIRLEGPIQQKRLHESGLLSHGGASDVAAELIDAGVIERVPAAECIHGGRSPWLFDPERQASPYR